MNKASDVSPRCHFIDSISPSFVLLLSPQILMSALKGSTTAGRTPCALTPPVPLCASAIRATSGSMTIPAQVSSSAGLLTGWESSERRLCFYSLLDELLQPFCVELSSRTHKQHFLSFAKGEPMQ